MLTASRGPGDSHTVRRVSVVRRLSAPRQLRIEADGYGTPRRLYHRGLWRVVAQVQDRWRTEDRWWTDEPVSREYFDLLLEDGRPMTVYFDRLSQRWAAH